MTDPHGTRGFTNPNFYLFKEDGTSTEHMKAPEPTELTEYIYAPLVSFWFGVQLTPGSNKLVWQRVEDDEVPAGLRALVLIML
jgi:hypothetical protein